MFLAVKYGRRKYREHKAQKQLQQQTRDGQLHSGEGPADNVDSRNPSASTASSHRPEQSKVDNHSNILTPEEKAENKRKNIYRWKIVLGLFAPFLLQALDTTIVASALPTIAEEFSKSYFLRS